MFIHFPTKQYSWIETFSLIETEYFAMVLCIAKTLVNVFPVYKDNLSVMLPLPSMANQAKDI